MEHLVRSCYKKRSGYVFAKKAEDIAREYGMTRIARLASNENPEPLSPAARAAAEEALLQVNRYPDERVNVLMNALRAYYGDYHFITGVGMDGVIETLIRTLVDPGAGGHRNADVLVLRPRRDGAGCRYHSRAP